MTFKLSLPFRKHAGSLTRIQVLAHCLRGLQMATSLLCLASGIVLSHQHASSHFKAPWQVTFAILTASVSLVVTLMMQICIAVDNEACRFLEGLVDLIIAFGLAATFLAVGVSNMVNDNCHTTSEDPDAVPEIRYHDTWETSAFPQSEYPGARPLRGLLLSLAAPSERSTCVEVGAFAAALIPLGFINFVLYAGSAVLAGLVMRGGQGLCMFAPKTLPSNVVDAATGLASRNYGGGLGVSAAGLDAAITICEVRIKKPQQ